MEPIEDSEPETDEAESIKVGKLPGLGTTALFDNCSDVRRK